MVSQYKHAAGSAPGFTWRDLGRHGRFALSRAWAVSPSLLTSLGIVQLLKAAVPVLFAIGSGLILREVKAIFDGEPGHEAVLTMLVVGVVALMLVETWATIAGKYVTSRLTDELSRHLSVDILEHLSSLDLAFFEDPASQDMAERASRQPGRDLVDFLGTTITIATQGVQMVSLTVVLVYIEPVLTPIIVLVSLPLLLFRWRMARLIYETGREQATKRRWSRYYSHALTSTAFLPTVKLFGLGPILLGRYTDFLDGIMDVNRRLYLRRAVGGAIGSGFVTLAALGLVMWVGYRTLTGQLSIQMFGTFVVGLNRVQGSIQSFVEALANSLEKVLFVSNLGELFDQQPTLLSGTSCPADVSGSIELRDVHFTYPGSNNEVIKGISMKLEPGKTVALVGPNGCGKTTLTRLIARLYDVDRGSIRLDGHDIRELSLSHLHQQIGYVSQSPVQFEATVHENIAYGDWERLAEDAAGVRHLAEQAQIDEMISRLDEGYATMLGRRFGSFDLSLGQWQKLSLARALAKDASILILDEPTASLDVQSELDMYTGFQKLAAGKTTLLISHRFSTVAMADQIYVMDDGRIVDHGDHAELLERGGMYAALYELHHRLPTASESSDA